MKNKGFKKSETWIKKGGNFSVEIKHWIGDYSSSESYNCNRWNVYVYFFPGFPGFDDFEESLMAHLPIEFNWGNTYEKFCRDSDGNITCKQYGNDYMHAHQIRFETYSTLEDAYEVLNDACEYFEQLSEIEKSTKVIPTAEK